MSNPSSTPGRGKRSRSYTVEQSESPPVSQKELLTLVGAELTDATWEVGAEYLARALSAKTRKKQSQSFDARDTLDNYHITLDTISPDAIAAAAKSIPSTMSSGSGEREHYPSLAVYLNTVLEACRSVQNHQYYKDLRFCTYDRVTQDGIAGASALKPDLAGVLWEFGQDNIWWATPPGHSTPSLLLPVEVKNNWPELIKQAGTYARCLFSAEPLRQFALVLGYVHIKGELRFLVFHRGGLTMSSILKSSERQQIVRLFLALCTWNTRGDAGLPDWCSGGKMRLPMNPNDTTGALFRVQDTLSSALSIRGRAPHVWRISRNEASGTAPNEVVRDLTPHLHSYHHQAFENNKNEVTSVPEKASDSKKRGRPGDKKDDNTVGKGG